MLYDSTFLKELDESREKTTYVRIISLDWDENPLEEIEGQVTTGSVNVDGNSAVRRTCSLTLVTDNININEYYWGLNTKFKLEIGLRNTVSRKGYFDFYPEIIWFKMGTYIIGTFSATLNTSSYTISISGKDKMCLLNGEVGGTINATTDFGTYDYTDENGVLTNQKYPIKQIIWDSVHAYANEPFYNIIINDLDEVGLELLEYKYDVPLYVFYDPIKDQYVNYTHDGDTYIWENNNENPQNTTYTKTKIKDIKHFKELIESLVGEHHDPSSICLNNPAGSENEPVLNIVKIEYGQTAGYRICELVYAGDLIANIGDAFTSVLDKIKKMLGAFEYFYDLDGRFVFQRQKSLVNTVWTPLHRTSDGELYVESLALASNSMYQFSGSILISSFQNSPNLMNLRNDYTVWGVRTGVNGQEYPVHMRYAIDNKPTKYVSYDGNHVWTTLTAEEIGLENAAKAITQKDYILDQMENFTKTEEYYVGINDDDWWEIEDWAKYYKILMGEYPGNEHPTHEMKYYCTNGKGTMQSYRDYLVDNYPDIPISGSFNSPTDTIEIFTYQKTNGKKYKYFKTHGSCVHTYGEFLEVKTYVNEHGNEHYQDQEWMLTHCPGLHEGTGRLFKIRELNYLLNGQASGIFLSYGRKDASDKLVYYQCYAYSPEIPEDMRERRFEELTDVIEYVDPYEGKYIFEIDWRELIYQMALDYRRYNHKDEFSLTIAKNNYPLYPDGKTGYEQYYTDMEGFWRQLYYPIYGVGEEREDLLKGGYELEPITYKYIDDLTNTKDIYILGMYKPVGQKVLLLDRFESAKRYKGTAKERLLWPYSIKTDTCILYDSDANVQYYLSDDDGFSFTEYNNINTDNYEEVLNYAKRGKLYTRDIDNVSMENLYTYIGNNTSGEIYPYMDQFNYVNATSSGAGHELQHFIKEIDSEDPQNPTYTLIDKSTLLLSSSQKLNSYMISNNVDIARAQKEYDDAKRAYELYVMSDSGDPEEVLQPLKQDATSKRNIYNQAEQIYDMIQQQRIATEEDLSKIEAKIRKLEEETIPNCQNGINYYNGEIQRINDTLGRLMTRADETPYLNQKAIFTEALQVSQQNMNTAQSDLSSLASQRVVQKEFISTLKTQEAEARAAADTAYTAWQEAQTLYDQALEGFPDVVEAYEQARINLNRAQAKYKLFKDYVRTSEEYKPTLNNSYIYDSNAFSLQKLIDAYEKTGSILLRRLIMQYCTIRTVNNKNTYTLKQHISTFALSNTGVKLPKETRQIISYYEAISDFYLYEEDPEDLTDEEKRVRFWNKSVFYAPYTLNFWFDFLVGDGELRQFTTQAVGDRPKAVNETSIKSIYYRDTPKIIFYAKDSNDYQKKIGYDYLQVQNFNMFTISPQGIDCKNKIDELIYQYSYCTESITVNSIPIYYLEPNRRISVFDEEANINGEYVISRISFPLSYNGTMSITATKAPENSVTEREE